MAVALGCAAAATNTQTLRSLLQVKPDVGPTDCQNLVLKANFPRCPRVLNFQTPAAHGGSFVLSSSRPQAKGWLHCYCRSLLRGGTSCRFKALRLGDWDCELCNAGLSFRLYRIAGDLTQEMLSGSYLPSSRASGARDSTSFAAEDRSDRS